MGEEVWEGGEEGEVAALVVLSVSQSPGIQSSWLFPFSSASAAPSAVSTASTVVAELSVAMIQRMLRRYGWVKSKVRNKIQ